MKITKTLFSKSIEIGPHELKEFICGNSFGLNIQLFKWLKKYFKLNLTPTKNDK